MDFLQIIDVQHTWQGAVRLAVYEVYTIHETCTSCTCTHSIWTQLYYEGLRQTHTHPTSHLPPPTPSSSREQFLVSPSKWKAYSISSHLPQHAGKRALCQWSRDLPQTNVCHLSDLSVCYQDCCPRAAISRPLRHCLSSHRPGHLTCAQSATVTYQLLFFFLDFYPSWCKI